MFYCSRNMRRSPRETVFGRLRIPRLAWSYTFPKILVPKVSEMKVLEFANSTDSDEAARNAACLVI